MIAHQLTIGKRIAPILNKPDLERDWPSILDSVYRILESFNQMRSRITSISLFCLGFSLVLEENPITVYVSVDYDCPESTWPPVIRAIESYIEGTTYDRVKAAITADPTSAAAANLEQKLGPRQRSFTRRLESHIRQARLRVRGQATVPRTTADVLLVAVDVLLGIHRSIDMIVDTRGVFQAGTNKLVIRPFTQLFARCFLAKTALRIEWMPCSVWVMF
ncbi:hypothetical protein M430DRAFT_175449 [Amorphotheca resinae ATCC 22711]|uniref:Uncharacterized protein n=1 Tax=Amorphotheca resinae ATCC 22711 TaxID=857342 RepID=A0A2T3ASR9_AMORE|nr:hypothetical protein M430DRAFT_175449 [Amorphotheca resinae ATCC 22711]PSS10523.1 hypothetical protein M430DRAFT_175449 [Amorphotheca resinae ATCC 22711]